MNLEDREAIRDCLMRYCRGIDRCDAELVKASFWPDAVDEHGVFDGNAHDFVDDAIPRLRTWRQTMHMLGQILIREEGGQAQSETYFTSYHRKPDGGGGMMEEFVGGRYLDRMEKRGDEWRISWRRVSYDWFRDWPGTPEWEKGFRGWTDRVGRRAPEDPVYKLFSGPPGFLPVSDDTSASALAEMQAKEDIRLLKAHYFRFVDEKRWDELAELFDSDAVFVARATGHPHRGRAAIMQWITSVLGPAQSVHHGHMPEIHVKGTEATGIWAMEDRVEYPDGTGFHGRGHYHESYAVRGGRWRITHLRFTRLRFEPLAAGFPGWMKALTQKES